MAGSAMTYEGTAPERVQPAFRNDSKSIFLVFLELFFGRWMIICGIFFAATIWSYLALARAPDTFEGTGQIMIRRGAVQAIQGTPILRQQEEVGSEVDIMLSIAVLDEVAKQLLKKCESASVVDTGQQPLIFDTYASQRPYNTLKMSDLPLTDPGALRKWLKTQYQIKKFGESNVIEVSTVSVNPVFAAEAVNTLIDVYEKFNMQVARSPGQSDYYRAEIAKLDTEINSYQTQLADYMQAHGIAEVEKERELVTLRRHAVQIELDKLQADKAALRTDLNAGTTPEQLMRTAFMRDDQSIVKLREQVFQREREIAELRTKSTEDNPLLKQKVEEAEALRLMLNQEEKVALAQQQHLYQQILDKEKELTDKIAMLDRQIMAFPTIEADVDRMNREIKQLELKRIDMVEQMLKATTLENPSEAMNKVKVLGYSQVPPFPREARKGFKFLVAVVLSAIAAFVAGLFVDGLDHSVRKREEIEEQLSVPYLASLSSHLR